MARRARPFSPPLIRLRCVGASSLFQPKKQGQGIDTFARATIPAAFPHFSKLKITGKLRCQTDKI
jgi:hypothetical protein